MCPAEGRAKHRGFLAHVPVARVAGWIAILDEGVLGQVRLSSKGSRALSLTCGSHEFHVFQCLSLELQNNEEFHMGQEDWEGSRVSGHVKVCQSHDLLSAVLNASPKAALANAQETPK